MALCQRCPAPHRLSKGSCVYKSLLARLCWALGESVAHRDHAQPSQCSLRARRGAGAAVHEAIEQVAALADEALTQVLAPLQDTCGCLCDADALRKHIDSLAQRLGPLAV